MRLSLLVVAAACGSAVGKGEMTFPSATKTSFGRIACSPSLDPKVAEGLVVKLPKRITWGDPLPICGYLRVGDDLRIKYPAFELVLERADKRLDQYRGAPSRELGNPVIDRTSPVYELLKQAGEAYFYVDGQHPFRELSPGEYDISISYLDRLRAQPVHLTVVAGGWRKEVADSLLEAVCSGSMLADLADYFDAVDKATRVDGDGDDRLAATWRKGFAKYKTKIADVHKPQLGALLSTDAAIPIYHHGAVSAKCPQKHVEALQLIHLFGGIRRFELH